MYIVGSSLLCDIQKILFVFKELFHVKIKTRMCTNITYIGKTIFCQAYLIKFNNSSFNT